MDAIAPPKINQLDWYNTTKLEKYAADAMLNFVIGERQIGKTTFFMKMACDLFKEEGLQTMWLRNKKVELQDPSFINDFLTSAKRFGWCPDEWVTFPEGVFTDKNKTEQVIKFQSISTFSNRRGNSNYKVGLIIFDEFMPEDRRYPKRCHIGLMSLIKTVLSGNDTAKVYCLSNFISAANPYFVGFEIYPDRKYDVTNFPTKHIAIEVCRGYRCNIRAESPWQAVFKAGGYQDYGNAEEDSLFELISPVPRGLKPGPWFVVSEGTMYGFYYGDGNIYWQQVNQPQGNNYTLFTKNLQEVNKKVFLISKWARTDLKRWMEENRMRFNNPNTMYAILSIMYNEV